ncbi:MAG TPA: condensation domain-containing protein, partial [Candidatus Deferrimicrobium sp.]|nr:condensation domain-containing protein [Candidatus Deferrimicrobium sp.]
MSEQYNYSGSEIAVIGMAGRFPGSGSIREYWENLKKGESGITFFSDQELEQAGVNSEELKKTNYVKSKGMLVDVEYFDASFFNFTVREAETMDPQMRLLHETCWHALEDAGYNPGTYGGSIGFYCGVGIHIYWMAMLMNRAGSSSELFELMAVNDIPMMGTQVAYRLNLRGPVVTLQTACSASLVSVHMAGQALLSGECDMALAGGVSVKLPAKSGYMYQEGMIMSRDGHCRPFDANASGTVSGEGVGIVVLKPLENAIPDRDHIYAVLKGTAINNDGSRRIGYSAPSIKGQAEVIHIAQQAAGVTPETITYVEAHGTGTSLGDPVEICALAQAFDTDKKQFCRIGSVKSNIGHLDAAAGIAGFIKTVLAIYHGMIPPSLHFKTPNPEIDFTDTPFIVNTGLYDWTTDGNPRRAGVSSFGVGGTNAHVILEEWTRPSIYEAKKVKETHLILLSSRTETGLERNTYNLAEFLKKNPGTDIAGTAYTLQTGRKAFAYRRTLVTQETTEAAAHLDKANNSTKVHTYHAINQNPPIVYIFSGLGSQYVDMGYNLYQQEPLFRKEMDACFEIIASLTGNNLKGLLYPSTVPNVFPVTSTQNLSHPEISQLVIFIIEYALASLLIKWGIYPHAMIGYSFGEYIAACIAGVITLEQGLKLVVQRGKLIARTTPGGMLSVPLTRRELELLLPENGEIYLAIDNGPSCIIAGPQEAIETFAGQMKKKKHLCMRLNANHAIHTPLMNSIRVEFEQKLKEIPWKEPKIPYISNLTGQWQTKEQAMDPGYWVRHLSSTVRFNEGINLLAKEPYTIFIELGPGRDISAMIQRTLDKTQHVINLIRPQQKVTADSQYLLERLGRLWLLGKDIDWKGYYESKADDGKRNRVSLPGYSFERQRFAVNGTNGIKSQVTETETGINKSSTYTYKPFQLPGETEAPRDELEAKITNAYRHIFGHEQIGIHDDFFELGGDSLKVITLVTDIHQQLNVDIPMDVVFKNPTVAELANYIGKKAGNRVYASIPQAEKKEYYPLSPSQLRVFIIEQIDEKGMAYNMPGATWMKGPLDIARLEKAYLQMIERHESLRTGFFTYREEPVQRIYEPNEIKFALEYFEIENIGDTKAAIEGIVDNFIKAFDISQPPLWQVGLVRASENKYLLLDKLHHIISDDISIGILMTEVSALYRGETLTKPVIQYKDYVEWQTKEGKNLLKEQEAFWLDCFHDAPDLPVLDLPFDFPRPALQSFDGDHIVRVIPLELKEKLYILARKNKTTLFVLLFSIYNILLYRYSRQEDIIVGIPITGRSHRDVQEIVGMFVNTLALRNYPRGNKTIESFLQEVKENTLKAFANQFYQFDDLVNRLALNRDMGRNPLFDALFVLHTVNVEKIQFPGIELSIYEHEHPFCRFDLTLNAAEFSKGINLGLEYTTALFKKETMAQFMENFFVIVETAVINPRATLDEIPMAGPRPGKTAGLLITDEDREKIVKEFNATSAPYPRERTLTELFADQVMQTPDHIALEAPAAKKRCALTYSKLNETSNQVARRLKTYGAGTAKIIAFLTDRSEKILVGLLAILKSGAAYLPIDPRYPGERMNYMVKDAKVTIILAAGFEIPFKHTAQVIDLTRESNFDTLEKGDLLANGQSTSPAYVIYTSGTTGKPKGVMIENRSVVNFIFGITRVIPFTHMDSILCLTSQGFDIFGLETLAPLLT